jgi:four helix bundle protein
VNKGELEQRTKQFAISVIRFVGDLPRNKVADVLGYQLLKSGTSVGANYREANRAQSRADFIHKIGIVEKEIAEAQYWLELFAETPFSNASERNALLNESNELISIFTAIGKSTRRNKKPKLEIPNPQSTSDKMGSKSELENRNLKSET